MQRRDFLRTATTTAACTAALTAAPLLTTGCREQQLVLPGTLLSGCDDTRGRHYIASVLPDGALGFLIEVASRVHDNCVLPDRSRALFFSRRPGRHLYVVDLHVGRLLQIVDAEPGRHFYGHGVVSANGEWLFATENNYASGVGIIGVYRIGSRVTRVAELPSHGVGPHQLRWLADGQTLVVANGGILTHPEQARENLNPDTMQPNLAYVRSSDGALLESHQPPHHQMSIRHLDVAEDQVVMGIQHQGALTDSVPLAGSHRRGSAIQWWMADELTQLRMRQYTASVSVDARARQALISCPRGNGIALWDLRSGTLRAMLDIADAAGLDRQPGQGGWIATSGTGALMTVGATPTAPMLALKRFPLRWDNHASLI